MSDIRIEKSAPARMGLAGNSILILLIFAVIAFIFTLPMFINIDNWGGQDWDQGYFYHAVPRVTILKYHQFPLWNPYNCGGSPLLAHPQSFFLSPLFSLILIFGEIRGMKIEIWLQIVIGMYGAYLLARHYKLNSIPSVLVPIVFMLSSMFTVGSIAGNIDFSSSVFIPWVFLCYLRSFENIRYVFASSIFCLLIYFGGGAHTLIMTVTFLAIYSGMAILCRKKKPIKTGKILSAIFLLTFLLGAVKFFPSIEIARKFPRKVSDYSGFSINSLKYCLFDRNQTFAASSSFPREKGFLNGMSWGMDENSMYIGFIPFALFLVGMMVYFKRRMALAITCLIFLWLTFGDRIPISIWKVFHMLPVYKMQRVATRYRFLFIFSLALFSGFGLQAVQDYIRKSSACRKVTRFIPLIIISGVLISLVSMNIPLWATAFVIPPLSVSRSDKFYQIQTGPGYDQNGIIAMNYRADEGSSYLNFLANIGTVDAYEAIPFPIRAIPVGSKDYKGEVFLAGTAGEARFKVWTPNKYIISVNAIDDGYLMVNQNYYPGWKVKGGNGKIIESREGLLSIKITPNDKEVEIYYLPMSFIIGIIVTISSIIISVLVFLALKNKATKI
jgi:hypothetical protein